MKSKDLLMFIHIEKSAGTSFKSILINNYFLSFLNLTAWHYWTNKDDNVLTPKEVKTILKIFPYTKAMSSHGLRPKFGYEEVLDRNINYVTLLRDPVERYMSQYYFQKNMMGIDWDFESFLEENYFNNFMVKKLVGENNLKRAKEVIDQFFFIGFVEQFDKSLILLKNKMNNSFNINYEKIRVNSNRKHDKYADGLTAEQLDAVKENNKLDMKLYNHAYNNFREEINKIANINKRESKFKNENQDYQFPSLKMKAFKMYRKIYYRNIEKLINRFYHGAPTKGVKN
ncbi:sulfotransferase family 2 domain-containing protein [Halanaerobacter jeridensis]|uniref:ABC-type antimicrobial peptide transport system permease subunit n=1 Tax=Halanaerobacter jeridensis TaxID=706427 RepID=A0A939BR25_9FIRM|nr:sulfotransferase family 2 domain-containing protein [Halanaerobacter jeridensis]MBM7556944.1 ABC-type antimicrobial peptide transport system permease subunit [Halanaerobacter jeridensis]